MIKWPVMFTETIALNAATASGVVKKVTFSSRAWAMRAAERLPDETASVMAD
jgi:hypothetical protein